MIKTTVTVEGMACGMCEAHINDAIRAAFPIKKVTSSRAKKETVILSETSLDHEAVKRAGAGGHKEINRTNLTMEQIEEGLKKDVVKKQIELLQLRKSHPAFGFDSKLSINTNGSVVSFTWTKDNDTITLEADFESLEYQIK